MRHPQSCPALRSSEDRGGDRITSGHRGGGRRNGNVILIGRSRPGERAILPSQYEQLEVLARAAVAPRIREGNLTVCSAKRRRFSNALSVVSCDWSCSAIDPSAKMPTRGQFVDCSLRGLGRTPADVHFWRIG